METIIFCSIVVAVVFLYAYANLHGRDIVRGVEAGPCDMSDYDLIRSRSFIARPIRIRDSNGHMISTKNFIRVVVCGNCMTPRKIYDNSQLLIEKIDPKRTLDEQIKSGDIIMIHLKEKHLDKIRVFERFDDHKQLVTYYFDREHKRKDSSMPHSRESVVGIVRYQI